MSRRGNTVSFCVVISISQRAMAPVKSCWYRDPRQVELRSFLRTYVLSAEVHGVDLMAVH